MSRREKALIGAVMLASALTFVVTTDAQARFGGGGGGGGGTIIPRPALHSRSPQQSSDKLDGLATAIWWGIARGAPNSTRG